MESEAPTELPREAQSKDLSWKLRWSLDDGRLVGNLTATNIATDTVRISRKPGLRPLGTDGKELKTRTIFSLERKLPGYAVLSPGAEATSPVAWIAWDGDEPSGEIRVRWPGGEAIVHAEGPNRPTATDEPTTLTSSWFSVRQDNAS